MWNWAIIPRPKQKETMPRMTCANSHEGSDAISRNYETVSEKIA